MAAAAPTQARWLKAESPHFVVYSDGDEASLRRQVDKLEKFDLLLRRRTGLRADESSPRKLPVYLVDGPADLRRLYPGAPDGMFGFYSSGVDVVFAAAIRQGRDDHTLLHEYTHHFMLQHRPYGYPAWFVEGFAEYFMTAEIKEKTISVGEFHPGRAQNLVSLPWIRLQDLLGRRPRELREGQERAMYYAQAWLLTHYLSSDPNRLKQFDSYLRAVGETGADPVKAMEQATGQSLAALDGALRRYVRGRLGYATWDINRFTPPQVTVTALPASADALLLEHQTATREIPPEYGKPLLESIRRRAAKYPGDRLAQMALARVEVRYGDRAAGEAILQRLIAADAKDVEALELLAVSRLAAGDADPSRRRELYREGRSYLARANRLDPQRHQTLYHFVRSRSVEPNYPSDNDMEALLAAHDAAPQVGAIRMRLAREMMRKGRYKEASVLLPPLANSPHGGPEGEAARMLLEEARAKASGAAGATPAG